MRIKLFSLLILLFLLVPSTTFAVDLFPLQVGQWLEFDKHDSADPQNDWTVRIDVLGTTTIGSYDYFILRQQNYEPGSDDYVPLRSTETKGYYYDGANDVLAWQIAAVGTTWDYAGFDYGAPGLRVRTIDRIETTVTVPYGTFNDVYVHRNYFNYDEVGRPDSPYWEEFIVQGVGMIKEVDYWVDPESSAPTISELARGGVVPEPISSTLFLIGGAVLGFRRFRNRG